MVIGDVISRPVPTVVAGRGDLRDRSRTGTPSGGLAGRPVRLALAGVSVALGAIVAGWLLYRNWSPIDATVWRVHPGWATLALLCSGLVVVGNALNLIGASPARLPFGPTCAVQVAGTVARLVSPAAVGGAALNLQYLRRAGMPGGVALGAVSAAQMIQVAVTAVLLPPLIMLTGVQLISAPDLTGTTGVVLLAGLAVAAMLVSAAGIILRTNPELRTRVFRVGADVAISVRALLERPARTGLSALGGVVLSLGLGGALCASVYAFGGRISLPVALVVVLFGSAAGGLVQVPGGLGPVEAALVAALVTAGVPIAAALPAVALYRLTTMWVHIPAGLLCAGMLRRRGWL